MRRRDFITLLSGAAVVWPLAASAQPGEGMRRIGMLQGLAADDPIARVDNDAFVHALQQLGWIDGHNVRIDFRFGAGNAVATRKYAEELVALGPDVIVAPATSVGPLLQATRTDRIRDRPRSGRCRIC
jgi:putative ABC transport system substrate-binding protein